MPKQPTLAERVSNHDREIAAIRALVRAGMKMLVRLEQGIDELKQGMKELQRAQQRTEQTLDRFIRSL